MTPYPASGTLFPFFTLSRIPFSLALLLSSGVLKSEKGKLTIGSNDLHPFRQPPRPLPIDPFLSFCT